MATHTPSGTHATPIAIERPPGWRTSTRVAFRFCFVYLGLYCLAGQVLGGLLVFPAFSFPMLGRQWPMRPITIWLAANVFHVALPLVYTGNSGDTAFYWVQTFGLLFVALVATLVWSTLDRRRGEYIAVHKWFRLFLRFALAAQMFDYGMAKIIPTQFPAPSLVTLVEPVGNLSLTDLLWTSIGASTAYQIFTGCAEMLGGLLLLVPRTAMLGAAICLADMIEVFVLNMTYDFGLKQISLHLILIALFLLAPDFDRLASFFARGRAPRPSTEVALFSTRRANQIMLAAQIVFGIYLLGAYTNIGVNYWKSYGGGGYPKSPLYGIWNVAELAVDGQTRSPLLNDYDRRWRRIIFDEPDIIVFERTDDSFAHYGVSVDVSTRSMRLTKGDSPTWSAYFNYERPSSDRLVLDGLMDNHRVRVELELVGLDTFRLLNGRFRWVRPPDPYAG